MKRTCEELGVCNCEKILGCFTSEDSKRIRVKALEKLYEMQDEFDREISEIFRDYPFLYRMGAANV